MNVSLKQLRAFVAVAEHQSFTKAAAALHSTQSAVSVLVRDLEAEVGFRLLDRTTRQVLLSEAGRDFFRMAQKLLDEFRTVVRDANDIAMLKRGVVRVGATEAAACSLIVPAIAAFQQTHPGIDVRLVVTPVPSMFASLQNGEVDYIIGPDSIQGATLDAGLQVEPLLRSPLRVWVRPDHPFAAMDEVPWRTLLGSDLVICALDFGSRLLPLVTHHLGDGDAPDDAVADDHAPGRRQVANVTAALSMVKEGLGVTFVAEYNRPLAQAFGLEGRELVEPRLQRVLALFSRRHRVLSPAAQKFAAAFREFLQASSVQAP